MIRDDIGLYVKYFHNTDTEEFNELGGLEEACYLEHEHYKTTRNMREMTKEEWEDEVVLAAI